MVVLRWLWRLVMGLLPAVLVTGGVLLTAEHYTFTGTPSWLASLPFIFLGIVLLLAVLFQQFRISLVVFPVTAVAWRCGVASEVTAPTALLASVVLPCWFTVVAVQRERRVLSPAGLLGMLISLVTAGLLLAAGSDGIREFMQPLYDVRRGNWEEWWQLAPASLGFLAAGWFTWLVVRRARTHALLLFSLMLVLLALNAAAPLLGELATEPLSLCAWNGAAVLLVWALLEGAWKHAFIDQLTGLPGRRALDQHLVSPGRRYAIAMADIDRFKRINDRHGHETGDQVLKYIASRLRAFRPGTAYRYGGEEFAIVFRRGSVESHVAALDELRQGIAGRPFVIRGPDRPRKKPRGQQKHAVGPRRKIHVTISIGIACRSDSLRSTVAVFEAADKALYRAKRKGRNRVCAA